MLISPHHAYLIAVGKYLRDEVSPRLRWMVEEVGMTQEADVMMAKLTELERTVDVVLAGLAQSKAQIAAGDADAKINAQALVDAQARLDALTAKLAGA
jgi:hypothetical protein